ncbi:hypothetical protein ACOSQ4_027254 [Xanthoceras sorbifolium]
MDISEVEKLCAAMSFEADKPVAMMGADLVNMGVTDKDVIMLLRCERLLEYCFECGFLGHSVRECVHGNQSTTKGGNEEFKFGSWLRVSSPVSTVSVPDSMEMDSRGGNGRVVGGHWKQRARERTSKFLRDAREAGSSMFASLNLWGGGGGEILVDSDKNWGNPRPRFLLENFRSALDYCGLTDLVYPRLLFTWYNKREGAACIQERLDRFLYEDCWIDHEECKNIVDDVWRDSGGRLEYVINCNVACARRLGNWSRWQLGVLRVAWLKTGDRNTCFFHSQASKQKKINAIVRLEDSNGVWQEDKAGVNKIVVDYFSDIFATSLPSQEDIAAVLETISQLLSPVSCRLLEGQVTPDEIKRALFQMAPSKAHGIYGFNACFYQRYWMVVGQSVSAACLSVLNYRRPMAYINHTLIVLIPKVDKVVRMGEFRPIILCNIVYKIISKVLENRLTCALGELILETQSAFIPGHLISDNPIVGFECMHALKRKQKGKASFRASSSRAMEGRWKFLCDVRGVFKLNVDASVGLAVGRVGLVLVVMNEASQVIVAGSVKLEAFFSPEVAEAIAISHGFQLAIDSGLSPLQVESDVLGVIKLLKDGSIPSSNLGLVISYNFSIYSRSNVLSFSFISRVANKRKNIGSPPLKEIVSSNEEDYIDRIFSIRGDYLLHHMRSSSLFLPLP